MTALAPLRPEIAITPMEDQEGRVFILHDSAGYAPHRLAVTAGVLAVLQLLDGVRTRDEVKAAFAEATGERLSDTDFDDILAQAEGAFFFDNESFFRRMGDIDAAFRESPLRAAACSGTVYEREAVALREALTDILARAPAPERAPVCGRLPRAVIAPHVDYQRGADAYGQCFRALAACPPPETVVILGTAHEGAREAAVLTDKDFETPFGIVRTDVDLVAQLAEGLPFDPFLDEARHRNEHSVELQLPFLRHIWGKGVRIVPVLCGGLFDIQEERFVRVREEERAIFAARLRDIAEERGSRLLILASADLSHVGPAFGDDFGPVNARLRESVMATDRDFMVAALDGSAGGAAFLLEETMNATHICGGACIHTMLLAAGDVRGTLLGYHQAPAEDGSQLVTFATAFFDPVDASG